MPEVRISTMDQDEDFAAWLTELLEREAEEAGLPTGFDDRYIGLTDAIGDWIGGLRYYVRGGVAHLLDLVVAEAYRKQGHAHRLLGAFQERAALGWTVVVRRTRYMNEGSWTLLEKRLPD